jgi:hypothetical protein
MPFSLMNLWFWIPPVYVVWTIVGEWFHVFGATTRRVIIMRTLFPRSWIFLDYAKMDPGWLRTNSSRGKIEFSGIERVFEAPETSWTNWTSVRPYIDNLPEIESVRALILERVATARAAAPSGKL